jgi:hypothetical protein
MQRLVQHDRRSGRLTWALRTALPVVLGLGLTACSDATPPAPKATAPTPLASYDGASAAVQRISFCTRIPSAAVTAAVGKLGGTRHYANGEQAPDTGDVAHEHGCIFDGESGMSAKAWVFAPPVTPEQAQALIAAASTLPGCQPVDAYAFGSPSLGTLCRGQASTTVTYRGLFGDAWLNCAVTAPVAAPPTDVAQDDKTLTDRAGTWCVQVAATAAS